MSFDVNVLSTKPVIKAAANMQNDGGSGGNLGYMERDDREQEKKKQKYDSLFAKKPEYDIIDFKKEIPMPQEENSLWTKLVSWILKVFKI